MNIKTFAYGVNDRLLGVHIYEGKTEIEASIDTFYRYEIREGVSVSRVRWEIIKEPEPSIR